jgi:uncharacterized membrane protein YuzA (DUF378 family)
MLWYTPFKVGKLFFNPLWEEGTYMTLHKVATLLVILGAANIGLSTLHLDLVAMFGGLAPIINTLIGISGIYMLLDTYTTLLKKTA